MVRGICAFECMSRYLNSSQTEMQPLIAPASKVCSEGTLAYCELEIIWAGEGMRGR